MKKVVSFDSTRDEQGNFKTGFRVETGLKWVWVRYITNIQGQRDVTWRLNHTEWHSMLERTKGDVVETCLYIRDCSPIKPYRIGQKIR